jgi:hypothetical protein
MQGAFAGSCRKSGRWQPVALSLPEKARGLSAPVIPLRIEDVAIVCRNLGMRTAFCESRQAPERTLRMS